MKFVWPVKDYLTAVQYMTSIIGHNFCRTFIHTLKLPEVMTFTGKVKIILVFIVVDRVYFFYGKL